MAVAHFFIAIQVAARTFIFSIGQVNSISNMLQLVMLQ
jgi:hypothetical protein